MDQVEQRAAAEQQYASLVVLVAQREALPVRAIPYVTGWTLSPDEVAKQFARASPQPFEKLKNTDTFHAQDGTAVRLLPKEWDAFVASLDGLEAELKEQFANDDRGYVAWLARSVAKLPAGVFVWLDEFTADFERDHSIDRLSIMGEREGDRSLNLTPFLGNETLNMVLDGFGPRIPLRSWGSDESDAGVVEVVLNGRLIDWQYWVESMPTLSSGEAARLMSGLDPELYEDLAARPVPMNDTSGACVAARRMERLAFTEGKDRRTSEEWYRWALEHNFSIHRGFFMAVYGRHLKDNESGLLALIPRAEARVWENGVVEADGRRKISVNYAGHVSTVLVDFPGFFSELNERLARWRTGRYTLIEAAQLIASGELDLNAELLSRQMDAALHAGRLTFRINNIRVDTAFIPQKHLWHRDVFEDDVNAWLAAEAIGPDLRLEYPYPEDLMKSQAPPQQRDAELSDAPHWWDATLNASAWWALSELEPREAATLLCQQDPHDKPTPEETTTSETSPLDFRKLLRAFEDATRRDPTPRSLAEWRMLAQRMGLNYHSWIDEYANAVGASPVDATRAPASPGHESASIRRKRRLARFQELGGVMKRVPGAWNVDTKSGRRGALADLVKEEQAAGRARSDRKDVSADLSNAAEQERLVSRA